jgi:Ca2+-binding EF-hand superfamily protein
MTLAAGREEGPWRGCSESFRAFDDNDDGRVSLEEFNSRPHARADPAEMFRKRDSDRDGSVSETEFCGDWRGGPGPGVGPGRGMGKGAGRGEGRGRRHTRQPMGGMGCEQHFAAFDSDDNGKVTKDEFLAWPHARGDAETIFAERDLDHDGSITRAEFCSPWKE